MDCFTLTNRNWIINYFYYSWAYQLREKSEERLSKSHLEMTWFARFVLPVGYMGLEWRTKHCGGNIIFLWYLWGNWGDGLGCAELIGNWGILNPSPSDTGKILNFQKKKFRKKVKLFFNNLQFTKFSIKNMYPQHYSYTFCRARSFVAHICSIHCANSQ